MTWEKEEKQNAMKWNGNAEKALKHKTTPQTERERERQDSVFRERGKKWERRRWIKIIFFFLRNIDSEKRGRVVLIVFPVHGKGFVRVAVAWGKGRLSQVQICYFIIESTRGIHAREGASLSILCYGAAECFCFFSVFAWLDE
jgi:hypothetical protein